MYRLKRMIINQREIGFEAAEVVHPADRPLTIWAAHLRGLGRRQMDALAAAFAPTASLEIEDTDGGRYVSPIMATSDFRLDADAGTAVFEFVALFRPVLPSAPG
jgi:hypothetical protein